MERRSDNGGGVFYWSQATEEILQAQIFGFVESGHSAVATNSLYLPEKKKTGSGY